jgi:hypothetical protein
MDLKRRLGMMSCIWLHKPVSRWKLLTTLWRVLGQLWVYFNKWSFGHREKWWFYMDNKTRWSIVIIGESWFHNIFFIILCGYFTKSKTIFTMYKNVFYIMFVLVPILTRTRNDAPRCIQVLFMKVCHVIAFSMNYVV